MISTFRHNKRLIRMWIWEQMIGLFWDNDYTTRRDYSRCKYFGDYSQTYYYDIADSELVCYIRMANYGYPAPTFTSWKPGNVRRPDEASAVLSPFRFHPSAVLALSSSSFGLFYFTRTRLIRVKKISNTHNFLTWRAASRYVFLECRNWSGFYKYIARLINYNTKF